MKKQVITIAGSLGSGKTTTSNGVAEALGYERFSAGDFQRGTAARLGLTYDEYQKVAEADPQYDRLADDALTEAGEVDGRVIDARLGYHFIPDSFKVFLHLDPAIAAKRIFEDAGNNPGRHKEVLGGLASVEDVARGIHDRLESEKVRYHKHYGITDLYDPKHFDLYIDTAAHSLEEVVQRVVEGYRAWLST